jgi:hypothetical protein
MISGNYPNPFNPRTTIRFAVPTDEIVQLAIYDVRGIRLRYLVDGMRATGWHEVVWDGRDQHGRPLASGIYFAHLKAGDESFTTKLMLAK